MDDSLWGHPYIYSSIAQLAEHAAVNRRVVGSSPTWGATKEEGVSNDTPSSFVSISFYWILLDFTGFYWILLDENIFSVFSVFFALAALCLRFSLVPLCGEKEMNF